jgi:phthiocerol/phenolphthiocerol synthesis type-I polyketide synthase E
MDSIQRNAPVDPHSQSFSGRETEKVLAEIWSEALRLAAVGRDDNFFELGGQSQVALTVLAKVTERFEVTLPLTAIFRYPTVREMAQLLEKHRSNGEPPSDCDEIDP